MIFQRYKVGTRLAFDTDVCRYNFDNAFDGNYIDTALDRKSIL